MQSAALSARVASPAASDGWRPLGRVEAVRALRAHGDELADLLRRARDLRDAGHGRTITYSRKAFFPITNLCRDRCAYCTFRRDEGEAGAWTMTPDEVSAWAARAHGLGCCEALMCLGDKPEAAFDGYRRWLAERGHPSTIAYVAASCELALAAGLLPHSNPGLMSADDLALLRPVNASLGLMLETTSTRLRAKGQVHYYAPDKEPALRLQVLRDAGEQRIPFTTGILIGIGETAEERVDSLLAIGDLHQRFGHVQEVIVQNFRTKPEIPMAAAEEPDEADLARTVAVARLVLGPGMNVQAPPNLSPDGLALLLESGINDLGGISPLTPDYVNPEAPWPHLGALARDCARLGYRLAERPPIYPEFADRPEFVDPAMRAPVAAWRARLAGRNAAAEATA
ncbi:MAG TPA: 7,8-didemethyl-8-hydroxy-5-deazariboflavin synthase CofG [Candidatus Binatia bacterium]|nr:7,8-didemethyl-8-hydroxy-5-deazariboflavin synthase CofG [Candidatus Binatia bacterium]